jgi:hypothetical protein
MFWIGAAPTVPGISDRFSSPGQPWARSIARSRASFRRLRLRYKSLAILAAQPRGDGHVQHQPVEVAGEHQVAAAEDEAAASASSGRRAAPAR